jgi:hypothetical protein
MVKATPFCHIDFDSSPCGLALLQKPTLEFVVENPFHAYAWLMIPQPLFTNFRATDILS